MEFSLYMRQPSGASHHIFIPQKVSRCNTHDMLDRREANFMKRRSNLNNTNHLSLRL